MLMEILNIIQTELKANKGQFNSFGNYKYRSLEDITEAVKPLLKEHGCVFLLSDEIVLIGDRFYVKATASLLRDKERIDVYGWARETEAKKGMDASQVTGATSSYARKYAANGLFAIDDTKDADTQDNREPEPKPKSVDIDKKEQLRKIAEKIEAAEYGAALNLSTEFKFDMSQQEYIGNLIKLKKVCQEIGMTVMEATDYADMYAVSMLGNKKLTQVINELEKKVKGGK